MGRTDSTGMGLPPDHPQADIPYNVPPEGFHVVETIIPFTEGRKESSAHHLVLGVETEGEAITAAQDRYYPTQAMHPSRSRWTAERCVRMNQPSKDSKSIVFKL